MSSKRPDSLDPEALSRPERSVYMRQGRSLADKVIACGGCYCCLRRDPRSEGWGRARCGKAKPAEFMKEGCTFEPDNDRIYDGGATE